MAYLLYINKRTVYVYAYVHVWTTVPYEGMV